MHTLYFSTFYKTSFMKKELITIVLLLIINSLTAQNVGINTTTPDASAALDITATDKGMLVPRMTTTQRTTITAPAMGLLVFDSDLKAFYFYNGTGWTGINSGTITESDPKVGSLTLNYMPKWNGTTLTNSAIFDNTGTRIGIGTISVAPESRLALGAYSGSEGGQLQLNSGTSGITAYHLDNFNDGFRILSGTNAMSLDTRMTINSAGNMGVGTSNPTEKLDVSGKTKTTDLQLTNGATNGYILQSDASGNGSWVNPTVFGTGNWTTSGTDQYNALSGNIGIGTTTPTEKLEVLGKTKTTDLQLTNGATNGYVLQSDASGNGSWVNSTSLLGASSLTTNYMPKWNGSNFVNSDIYYNNGRTSLGTTTTQFGGNFDYSRFTLASSSSDYTDFNVILAENSTYAPFMNWGKARGSLSSKTSVQNGDQLFILNAHGYDGSRFIPSASIEIKVDGTPTTNKVPSSMVFSTTLVGNTGSNERMRITNAGNIGIGTTAPTEKLEVDGKTKTTNFQMTNGATNGYLLQSDASGNGSWVSPTTFGTGNWTAIGTDQYNALSGNVGIGTSSPSVKLEVLGTTSTTNLKMTNGATNGYLLQSDASGNGTWVSPTTLTGVETDPQVASSTINYVPKWNGTALQDGIIYDSGYSIGIGTTEIAPANLSYGSRLALGALSGTEGGQLQLNSGTTVTKAYFIDNYNDYFRIASGTNTGSTDLLMTISSTGNVGIGTTFPAEKLEVNGKTKTTNFQMTNGATNGYVLQTDAAGNGSWVNSTSLKSGNWTTSGNSQYSALSGHVGIGTSSPTEKLEVNGKTKTTDFQMTNGAANGYVLQSDASGNATWIAATSTSGWTVSGNNQYTPLSGNIGIGTNSPSTKLHVVGNVTLAGTVNFNSNWNIQTGSDFYLEKSGTRYLTVYGTGGNVGIGTTAPNYKLDVQSTTSTTAQVQSSGAGAFISTVAPSGQEASANFKTYSGGSASSRWTMGKSTATEAGSNAGSNFFIDRHDDAGTYLGQPLAINRQDGTVTVGNDGASATKSTFKVNGSTEVKLITVNSSSTTTTLDGNDYMVIYNGSTSGNSLSLPTASSCAGRVYMVVNHSASSVIVTNTYLIANGSASPTITAGSKVQLVSDGSSWHKMN
jgi:hypothetical protein